jgi:hypothetical protein
MQLYNLGFWEVKNKIVFNITEVQVLCNVF